VANSGALVAQTAAVVTLKSPDVASQEFTRVVSSRELADGRLLVAEGREKRVMVVAFDGSAAVQLGRVGSGPGEYRTVGRLVSMPGDSTLLADFSNGRWLLFSGATIGGAITAAEQHLPATPVGVSSTHLYGYRYPVNGMGASGHDTVALVRIPRRSSRTDTVALLAGQTVHRAAPKVQARVTTIRISVSSWSAGDQALLFDDGWLAIARVTPYRVDWISPDGRLRAGKALRAVDPPFTDDEKRAFMDRVARETGRPVEPIDSRSDWPDVVTAFTSMSPIIGDPSPALFAAPGGKLLVRRQVTAQAPRRQYDVIDRSGSLLARLELGENETLVGAGKAHLYTVVTDDDGIQKVRRYAFPFPDGRRQ
jgi:hypothetical protein